MERYRLFFIYITSSSLCLIFLLLPFSSSYFVILISSSNSINYFKIKNLDTGEYYDIDEAVQKFNVMGLELR